jgi:hypothetical protein
MYEYLYLYCVSKKITSIFQDTSGVKSEGSVEDQNLPILKEQNLIQIPNRI